MHQYILSNPDEVNSILLNSFHLRYLSQISVTCTVAFMIQLYQGSCTGETAYFFNGYDPCFPLLVALAILAWTKVIPWWFYLMILITCACEAWYCC